MRVEHLERNAKVRVESVLNKKVVSIQMDPARMDALRDTKEYFAQHVCVKQLKHSIADIISFDQYRGGGVAIICKLMRVTNKHSDMVSKHEKHFF